ncbi:MAG: ligase-associated DNA damage response endonuclease PdeM [Phycisphaerales bacterium]
MSPTVADQTLTLGGHEMQLLPERAIHWPHRRWLLVADTHWGKCQTFRDAGAGLSSGPLRADLERLRLAAQRVDAQRIVVLGDLIHSRATFAPGMRELLASWRGELNCELALVPGNHDRVLTGPRGAQHLRDWAIELLPERVEADGLVLAHEPPDIAGPPTLCGHVHPAVRMRGRGESMKLPCFWFEHACNALVLPAFSSFADGACIKSGPEDQRWAIAADRVLRV